MSDDEDMEALDGVGIPANLQRLSDCIKVYKGCNVNYPYYLSLPDLERFQTTANDVAICGFPKSGSAWLSAIVTMIQANGDPASLLQGAPLDEKVPYLEFCTPANYAGYRVVDRLSQQPGGRTFFTHLSYNALPPSITQNKTKIIYHIRNPKDVIVSTYFHLMSRRQSKFGGNLDVMVDAFVDGTVCYGPYFDHIAGYWKHRHDPDVFVLSFEQLSQDFDGNVRELAKFLGKQLTEQQFRTIAHHCSFEQMKENERTNRVASDRAGVLDFQVSPFLRAGSVGNWKVHFSREMDAKVDAWIEKNLQRPDLAGLAMIFE
ncbi:putative Sulfotransferase family cytosolic 1B member 1 [Hypsibius exemplaris]|uniref:Sulfotransferase family cytosolic 1B member 1 n=1 Tax=Hypsibius exemplaris TaxID=2072580 RepID=A0A9X6RM92_HYPEX|nr:putative Sulfotransferase family cytosolic 1B member 1 [Hypsibius exemplaris]